MAVVTGPYETGVDGRLITVADLTRAECPECGEVLFSAAAIEKIESYWPADKKSGAADRPRYVPLDRIKRACLQNGLIVTDRARSEMDACGLTEQELVEAVWNAHRAEWVPDVYNPVDGMPESIYAIKGLTLANAVIRVEGKFFSDSPRTGDEFEKFYVTSAHFAT